MSEITYNNMNNVNNVDNVDNVDNVNSATESDDDTNEPQNQIYIILNIKHVKFCVRFLIVNAFIPQIELIAIMLVNNGNHKIEYIMAFMVLYVFNILHISYSYYNSKRQIQIFYGNDSYVTLSMYNAMLVTFTNKYFVYLLECRYYLGIIPFICCFTIKQQGLLILFVIITIVEYLRIIIPILNEFANPKRKIFNRNTTNDITHLHDALITESESRILLNYSVVQCDNLHNIINDECSVCLKNFSESDKLIKLKCDHVYHLKCIATWGTVRETCPLCEDSYLQIEQTSPSATLNDTLDDTLNDTLNVV